MSTRRKRKAAAESPVPAVRIGEQKEPDTITAVEAALQVFMCFANICFCTGSSLDYQAGFVNSEDGNPGDHTYYNALPEEVRTTIERIAGVVQHKVEHFLDNDGISHAKWETAKTSESQGPGSPIAPYTGAYTHKEDGWDIYNMVIPRFYFPCKFLFQDFDTLLKLTTDIVFAVHTAVANGKADVIVEHNGFSAVFVPAYDQGAEINWERTAALPKPLTQQMLDDDDDSDVLVSMSTSATHQLETDGRVVSVVVHGIPLSVDIKGDGIYNAVYNAAEQCPTVNGVVEACNEAIQKKFDDGEGAPALEDEPAQRGEGAVAADAGVVVEEEEELHVEEAVASKAQEESIIVERLPILCGKLLALLDA